MQFNPWFLLAAVPVFALLVLVHEFGHFLVAKWAGIRVEEFAIGFPPRLFSVKRGETTYSINLLPIGGYVRMPGENGETTDENGAYDPRSFASKSAGKRAAVLAAGVTMNILLAFVVFTAAELAGQPRQPSNVPPIADKVVAGSPAAAAGMRDGDTIVSINGQQVTYWQDITTLVGKATDVPPDVKTVPVTVVVRHKGSDQPVTLTVRALAHPARNEGRLGIQAVAVDPIITRVPVWEAPIQGVRDMGTVVGLTGNALGQVITGKQAIGQVISGPVGIVNQTGEVASTVPTLGWYWMFYLIGALSVSLALVNILPIPALDGGRLLFIGIEVLRRGRRISPEREALVNLIGMGVLLGLMLLVTLNDVGNIIAR